MTQRTIKNINPPSEIPKYKHIYKRMQISSSGSDFREIQNNNKERNYKLMKNNYTKNVKCILTTQNKFN